MDMAQFDPIRPTDRDMHWMGWALDSLCDVVELDIRTMRMTAQEQAQILRDADAPAYPLMHWPPAPDESAAGPCPSHRSRTATEGCRGLTA